MHPMKSAPSSVLWATRKAGRQVECLVRLLPVGIDVRIEWDGTKNQGRIFQTQNEALAWPDEERQELLAKGRTEVRTRAGSPNSH
jgi:hypothetical protein